MFGQADQVLERLLVLDQDDIAQACAGLERDASIADARRLPSGRQDRDADRILGAVRCGSMPCDVRWPDEQVDLLQALVDGDTPE